MQKKKNQNKNSMNLVYKKHFKVAIIGSPKEKSEK